MKPNNDCAYDFFGQIAVAGTLEAFGRAAIPFLSHRFSAQSVLAIGFHRSAIPEIHFSWIPDPGLRTTFDHAYARLGYMLDPFYQRSWLTPDIATWLVRDIAPDRFESSQYFANYFAATEMVDDMGLIVRLSANRAVHLSLGRSSGHRRFRTKDLRSFDQIAKVLAPKLRALLIPQTPQTTPVMPSLDQRFIYLAQADGKKISQREAQVAALIVQGYSSRAIALKLGITIHTVKVHRRALYRKLTITSQSELFGLLTRSSQMSK